MHLQQDLNVRFFPFGVVTRNCTARKLPGFLKPVFCSVAPQHPKTEKGNPVRGISSRPLRVEHEHLRKGDIMEIIITAVLNSVAYQHKTQAASVIPEPEFRPFNLRARSSEAEDDSSSRPSDRMKSLVTQIAS